MFKKWSRFFISVILRFVVGYIAVVPILTIIVIGLLCAANYLKLQSSPYDYGIIGKRSFWQQFTASVPWKMLPVWIGFMSLSGGILAVIFLPWKELPWRQRPEHKP